MKKYDTCKKNIQTCYHQKNKSGISDQIARIAHMPGEKIQRSIGGRLIEKHIVAAKFTVKKINRRNKSTEQQNRLPDVAYFRLDTSVDEK